MDSFLKTSLLERLVRVEDEDFELQVGCENLRFTADIYLDDQLLQPLFHRLDDLLVNRLKVSESVRIFSRVRNHHSVQVVNLSDRLVKVLSYECLHGLFFFFLDLLVQLTENAI